MWTLPADSIGACITDPPYNYEIIGRNWNEEEARRRVDRIQNSSTLVKNIPYGSGLAGGVRNLRWYERNRQNVIEYQEWVEEWARALYRVCKHGAPVAVFSSTRTAAHVQVGLEAAGFYARDMLVYRRNSGIPKGLNVAKKLAKSGDPAAAEWEGWHSCFRNEWEAIVLVQKPLLNNYLETLAKTGVGVFKTVNGGGGFQSNILEGYEKSGEDECDAHFTVKPLALIRKLIQVLVPPGPANTILDPFAGSGTTLIAAAQLGYRCIGIEIEPSHVHVMKTRLETQLCENRDRRAGRGA